MTTPTAADGTPITSSPMACMRKRRFESEAKGWEAIFRMRARQHDTTRLVPYECAYCRKWHLGRTPPRLATDQNLRKAGKEAHER